MGVIEVLGRFQPGQRIFEYENYPGRVMEYSDELAVSSSDSVFGFLEGSVESTGSSNDGGDDMFDVDDEEGVFGNKFEENKCFWENLHKDLKGTLCRTSSIETGIRNVTREAVKNLQAPVNYCTCGKSEMGNNCRDCLMREVSCRLSNAGYNTAICRSKWRSSPEIPSGEHTFLDVIDNTNPVKGEIRIIIELNFRAEFEMARASDEYNQLINRLPEIFVAKIDRLKPIIKILCTGAKKCMKDKKMHMGPWRKQKYMQAKWFSSNCQRMVELNYNVPLNVAQLKQTTNHARASMLTMALLGTPRKAVAAA
ncbi:uncharacterized protein LOC141596093 [Silene latifolia]|uniref:uncharacterized protein LOC141596093 n=1 Tax=Silene latifolia TaxID=37657 RepID=UPI003D77DEFB